MGKRSGRTVGVGIIGCGGIARGKHLPELEPVREMRLVACADLIAKRAREVARRGGASLVTDDYHELLACDEVDAVIVSTPHPSHGDIGIDVLKARKHLLVQKPMTTTVRDADRLLRAARRSRKVALALPYLYGPWLCKIADLLERGAVGTVRMARCRVAHDADHKASSWFTQKDAAHGGALFDMGVYAAALLVDLLGRATAISGMFTAPTGGATAEQNVGMTLRFACGAIGVLETSWQEIGYRDRLTIYGSTGTLDCPAGEIHLATKPTRKGGKVRWKRVPPSKRIPMPQNVCRHWADCISRGRKPLIPISRGRHLVEILCAGYQAAATGREAAIRSNV